MTTNKRTVISQRRCWVLAPAKSLRAIPDEINQINQYTHKPVLINTGSGGTTVKIWYSGSAPPPALQSSVGSETHRLGLRASADQARRDRFNKTSD